MLWHTTWPVNSQVKCYRSRYACVRKRIHPMQVLYFYWDFFPFRAGSRRAIFSPALGIFFPDLFCFPSPTSILPLPFHAACYLQHFGAGTFHFACYLQHFGAGTLSMLHAVCSILELELSVLHAICRICAQEPSIYHAICRICAQEPFSLRAICRIWELEPSMLLCLLLLRLLLLCLLLCCLLL